MTLRSYLYVHNADVLLLCAIVMLILKTLSLLLFVDALFLIIVLLNGTTLYIEYVLNVYDIMYDVLRLHTKRK